LTLVQRVISIAYPVQDIVLLAVAVRLWRGDAQRNAAYRLLAGGLLALLVADTMYGLSLLTADFAPGGTLDRGWVVFFVALGAAALHPSMGQLSEKLPPRRPG
jgi:hypothetical protein